MQSRTTNFHGPEASSSWLREDTTGGASDAASASLVGGREEEGRDSAGWSLSRRRAGAPGGGGQSYYLSGASDSNAATSAYYDSKDKSVDSGSRHSAVYLFVILLFAGFGVVGIPYYLSLLPSQRSSLSWHSSARDDESVATAGLLQDREEGDHPRWWTGATPTPPKYFHTTTSASTDRQHSYRARVESPSSSLPRQEDELYQRPHRPSVAEPRITTDQGSPPQEEPPTHFQEKTMPLSTLEKTILKEGSGDAAVTVGMSVTVHATGSVLEGNGSKKKFWSTKDPGQQPLTYSAGVGQVIKGWDEGVLGMKLGEIRSISVPAAMGYGESGFHSWGIPANADLHFEIEVLNMHVNA